MAHGTARSSRTAKIGQITDAHPQSPVNRRKRPSLAEQVREGLLDDLIAGKLKPGDKLPNENELADRFDIFSGFDIRDEFSDPCSGRHVVLHRGFRVLYRSIHTIWQ